MEPKRDGRVAPVVDELHSSFRQAPPDDQAWGRNLGAVMTDRIGESGMRGRDWLDAVALDVARGFLSGRLDWEFSDALANGLWTYIVADVGFDSEFSTEMSFFRVFDAFDGGEFVRDDDPFETDPVERYTRPQLEALLAGLAVPEADFGHG